MRTPPDIRHHSPPPNRNRKTRITASAAGLVTAMVTATAMTSGANHSGTVASASQPACVVVVVSGTGPVY